MASAIVGHSPALQRAQKLITRASSGHEPMLVRGESGTGKELVIQTIHELSAQAVGPLLRIACRAVPEEANLFGPPDQRPVSRLAEASGGTLFLDEVADLSLSQQGKLSALLSQQEHSPTQPSGRIKLPRIAATTAKDLESLTAEGVFDSDLYRHFAPMVISLPPLRERQQDIPALVDYFVTRDHATASITAEALAALCDYTWPGNVQELEETILQAMVLARDSAGNGPVIGLTHLKLGASGNCSRGQDWTDLVPLNDGWRDNIDKLEKALVTRSLSLSKGNKSKAAEALRIHRRLLYEKLRQFQMAK